MLTVNNFKKVANTNLIKFITLKREYSVYKNNDNFEFKMTGFFKNSKYQSV